MKGTLALAALLTLAFSNPTPAADSAAAPEPAVDSLMLDQLDDYIQQEERHRALALETAPIKSRSDLAAHMRRSMAVSPLAQLSPRARQRFVASLTFNRKGLTGFDYSDLVNELTASGIHRVLSLFGMQHTTSLLDGVRVESDADRTIMRMMNNSPMLRADHDHMECVKHGTCGPMTNYICTSNC